MGCHFLPQCMKAKSENEIAQSCPTLRDPMDCSSPGSSIRGIFQARVLEWGAIAFSIKVRHLTPNDPGKGCKHDFPVTRVKGKNQEEGRGRGETGCERCPPAAPLRTGVSGASQGTPVSPHQPPCLRCCSSCPSRPLALPIVPIQPVPLLGIPQCSSMVPSFGVHALGLTLTCPTTSLATQGNIYNCVHSSHSC